MKPNMITPLTTVDRLATPDEVLEAVLFFRDSIEDCAADLMGEIAADVGGSSRTPSEEIETSLMPEEVTGDPGTWPN
jgi:hypothetical protein